MSNLFRREPLGLLESPHGDDVTLAHNDAIWIIVSEATLSCEQIVAYRHDGTQWHHRGALNSPGTAAFRPAVASFADGIVAAYCVRDGQRFGIQGRFLDTSDNREFSVPCAGSAHHVAVSAAPDQGALWLAWEQHNSDKPALIQLAVLDYKGDLRLVGEIAHPAGHCRHPTLYADGDHCFIAWSQQSDPHPARIGIAKSTENGITPPIWIDPQSRAQEAPTITRCQDRLILSWHAIPATQSATDSITRWIHLATVELAAFSQAEAAEPEQIACSSPNIEQSQAGFDQGWEFPTIAVDTNNAIWVAGRSSHGFHLALSPPGMKTLSQRISLSNQDWGGRGRRCSLVAINDHVIFGRRERQGFVVERIRYSSPPQPSQHSARMHSERQATKIIHHRKQTHPPVLFGDLHQHTAHSDGCGTLESLWHYARHDRNLDFAAITDHDRFCGRSIGPATWALMCELAEAFHIPGEFVTFPAYEFTGPRHPGPGHKCIYFPGRVPERIPEKNVDTIFETLRQTGGIAIPHHVGWTGADMEHHDPHMQPVWEICSVHGCYECHPANVRFPPRSDLVLPDQFIKPALDAGHRFGFIGSTDSHGLLWHHGISPKRNPFATGLACVIGAERQRESIVAAIRARRTYATTGARIIMTTDVDGAPMGSELPRVSRANLRIHIVGTAPLQSVTAVTSREEIPLDNLDDIACDVQVTLRPTKEKHSEYVYVRVVQKDGEIAWSSPYWFG